MQNNTNNASPNTPSEPFGPAETGNASNPSSNAGANAPNSNQLLDEKAEKYLRESAPVEDYPDEQDWEEANKIIDGEKEKGTSNDQ